MKSAGTIGLIISFCMCFYSFSQSITGRIIDGESTPVSGASVILKSKNITVQSDALGKFTINVTSILSKEGNAITKSFPHLYGSCLVFSNDLPQQIKIELFDMSGKRLSDVFDRLFGIGNFSFPISSLLPRESGRGLYVARIVKGTETYLLPFCPMANAVLRQSETQINAQSKMLAKRMATADTLIVSKQNYIGVSKPISYDQTLDAGDITLISLTDLDSAVEKKVDSLLALMNDDDKIAQTAEVLVNIVSTSDVSSKAYGSVFNGGGVPSNISSNDPSTWATILDQYHTAALNSKFKIPILYGIDAVHGVGTIKGATVFPHNIGMGCTGDSALAAKMANIVAREMRAVGINLNFGPAIPVARDERWGRTYESYGETPEINSMMGAAYVRGLQGFGDISRSDAAAACSKHFIGDGGTDGGVNGGITTLSEATMRAIHLPPYQAVVNERVSVIMPSYNAWSRNGQTYRCTNDSYSLTTMLKTGLSWNGFCLSDWDAIPQALASTSGNYYETNNVSASINAGMDMAMISQTYSGTLSAYITQYITAMGTCIKTSSSIPRTRLDDAVKRILRIKFRMNLFQNPKSNATLRAEFGSAAHRMVARECVRKSLVLLKNDVNTLPLKKTDKVVVVGPWANQIGAQCGGWTLTWQGDASVTDIGGGATILKALQDTGGANVTYDAQGNNLAGADKIVLVVGEASYSEGQGDNGHTNSDGSCPQCDTYKNKQMSINLSDCPNAALVDKCVAANKPLIIILISGRPMIIADQIAKSKAFVAAWLPGSEGGGVADVLYGAYNFTGKLRHTWPNTIDQVPINTGTVYSDEKHGSGGTPLFNYGYGLTY